VGAATAPDLFVAPFFTFLLERTPKRLTPIASVRRS